MTQKEQELAEQIKSLQIELDRIKDGIKRCQITLIIDGNDMCDWGWTTINDMNNKCQKKYGSIPTEVLSKSLTPTPQSESLIKTVDKLLYDFFSS